VQFHAAGKVDLDHIYTQPDPRAYFTTLRPLEYHIPQLAKEHIARLVEEVKESRRTGGVTVLDVGCSYGINGALLRCDATMNDLYERYCGHDDLPRSTLLTRDRQWTRAHTQPDRLRILGLDVSSEALSFAVAAGFLDDAVNADLENGELTPAQCMVLEPTDVVVSTGCLGYVTERTIAQVAAAPARRPWMAHTILRMYRFEPVAECLAGLGYDTVRVGGPLKQRRFASAEEQANVLDTLADLGVDPAGFETDGWLYAELFVSRPRDQLQ
jgi:SAM-dependent methyltransferase